MSDLIEKTYQPREIEKKWYAHWEKNRLFKPHSSPDAQKTYCVLMPPPNVTGKLHMGHALNQTCQDIIVRYKRMQGFSTLWIPGQDHAGIATQAVVEKHLQKSEQKTKHDLGRENFINLVWEWKEKHGNEILEQFKELGISVDWDYFLFTMDEDSQVAVKKFFTLLYNEKLIYQAEYIVNWSPKLQSAISDAEVEYKEVGGNFYYLKYPVKDSGEILTIATTRPETLFGDTAVAVHPEDSRYQHLIGKEVSLPLTQRTIPIIADEHVDRDFGSACLKVTPGHDFNDFEIGKRHNLPILTIIEKDGKLNTHTGEFQGLSVQQARPLIVKKLQEEGHLLRIEEHKHSVGHCSRSGCVIEPLVSTQWFLNTQQMAQDSVDAVEKEDMKFIPKGWENTFFSWMRNPRPWCLSRQLWWGHQIPVFYCQNKDCQHQWASEEDLSSSSTCPKCQQKEIKQDPDVLDTWFSSALWPLSTLGWPDQEKMKEKHFDAYFPSDVLITGYDIIFFWIARMMMFSLKVTGKTPFHLSYIHGIVRDKQGRKMSKSLGNGIDPRELIAQYGTDALRFALATGAGHNRGMNLDPQRIEGHRNFMNKLWNVFRFVQPFIEDQETTTLPPTAELHHHEKWILHELNDVIEYTQNNIESFRYNDAALKLYSFIYELYCSWFIEVSKPLLYGEKNSAQKRRILILKYTFKQIVALIHPFTPYISEEIWSHLKTETECELICSPYPQSNRQFSFPEDSQQMQCFMGVVTAIRDLRQQIDLPLKDKTPITLSNENQKYFEEHEVFICELANVSGISFTSPETKPPKSIVKQCLGTLIYLPLSGVIDISAYLKKLTKQQQKKEKEAQQYTHKMNNKNFIARAPQEVVAEIQEKLNKVAQEISDIKDILSYLS